MSRGRSSPPPSGFVFWTNGIGVCRLGANEIALWLADGPGEGGEVFIARDGAEALRKWRDLQARRDRPGVFGV